MCDIRERCVRKGFSEETLTECLSHYERLSIWMIQGGGETLKWMDVNEMDSDDDEENDDEME